MIKKRVIAAIISAIVIIGATIFILLDVFGVFDISNVFKKTSNGQSITINLYFLNEHDTNLVAENTEISYDSEDNIPYAVINALIAGPASNKNHPIFENNIKVNYIDLNKREKDLIVDFSSEYYSSDTSKMFLSTYAVVKSLCQLDSVDRVMVTVNSEELISSDGTIVSYLSDEDIDLVTDTKSKDSKPLTLYFVEKGTNAIVSEIRTIKITDTLPTEQYVVNELIKGPASQNMSAVLSPDTELVSAQTTDGICFLNFKENFIENNQQNSALVVNTIVKSLCELDNVIGVQFLIDGKKTDFFGSVNISNTIDCNSVQ